jgi:flagellar M-ring protein FliF
MPQVVTQLAALWKKQSRTRRLVAIVALIGVLGAIAWTAVLEPAASPWVEVVPGGSADDAAELTALLGARDIPFKMRGRSVDVPSDRIAEARAIAGAAGLPRAGAGFELFDHSSLGQSAFAEQVNYRRALQGELARSITAMAQVEGARVHLAMGKRSVFKDGDQLPSASVALRLHPGQQLTRDQVHGIRQLVAASIDGLKPDAVVVVDNRGTPLDGGPGGANGAAEDQRGEIERAVAGRVRAMLERAVGAGKVAVVATADVDNSRVSETEEIYDKDKTALRSESRTVDGPDAGAAGGGVAGVRGNLPGAAAGGGGSPEMPGRLQETKNYEVSRVVRQTAHPEARLRKLHLAVMIDYKAGDDGTPVARTTEELAELAAIARQAAGLDDARGDKLELKSMPFVVEADEAAKAAAAASPGTELPIIPIAAGAGGLVVLSIIVMLIRRGKSSVATPVLALPAPVAELERMIDGPSDAPRAVLPGKTIHDRVLDSVRGDTARAAAVLTAWLAESNSKGARS